MKFPWKPFFNRTLHQRFTELQTSVTSLFFNLAELKGVKTEVAAIADQIQHDRDNYEVLRLTWKKDLDRLDSICKIQASIVSNVDSLSLDLGKRVLALETIVKNSHLDFQNLDLGKRVLALETIVKNSHLDFQNLSFMTTNLSKEMDELDHIRMGALCELVNRVDAFERRMTKIESDIELKGSRRIIVKQNTAKKTTVKKPSSRKKAVK